jgi:hypothetical protein
VVYGSSSVGIEPRTLSMRAQCPRRLRHLVPVNLILKLKIKILNFNLILKLKIITLNFNLILKLKI